MATSVFDKKSWGGKDSNLRGFAFDATTSIVANRFKINERGTGLGEPVVACNGPLTNTTTRGTAVSDVTPSTLANSDVTTNSFFDSASDASILGAASSACVKGRRIICRPVFGVSTGNYVASALSSLPQSTNNHFERGAGGYTVNSPARDNLFQVASERRRSTDRQPN
jgi:hypothetical protein